MKKVERVELVLENCEVFEIRAEDIGFLELKMAPPTMHITKGEMTIVSNVADYVFIEAKRVYGTFVFDDSFVEGKDYVVKIQRLMNMDIVYLVIHYVDGTYEQVYVPFNDNGDDNSWDTSNKYEIFNIIGEALYVRISSEIFKDRLRREFLTDSFVDTAHYRFARAKKAVEDRKNSDVVKAIHHSLEESLDITINPVSDEERKEVERKGMDKMGEFMRTNAEIHEKYTDSSVLSELLSERLDSIPVIPSIQLDEIKVGGRVAYVNRQGDVVAEYVTDISGEFVGLRSGNVIHHTKVTALVVG